MDRKPTTSKTFVFDIENFRFWPERHGRATLAHSSGQTPPQSSGSPQGFDRLSFSRPYLLLALAGGAGGRYWRAEGSPHAEPEQPGPPAFTLKAGRLFPFCKNGETLWAGNVPMWAENVPLWAENVPLWAGNVPLWAGNVEHIGRH